MVKWQKKGPLSFLDALYLIHIMHSSFRTFFYPHIFPSSFVSFEATSHGSNFSHLHKKERPKQSKGLTVFRYLSIEPFIFCSFQQNGIKAVKKNCANNPSVSGFWVVLMQGDGTLARSHDELECLWTTHVSAYNSREFTHEIEIKKLCVVATIEKIGGFVPSDLVEKGL